MGNQSSRSAKIKDKNYMNDFNRQTTRYKSFLKSISMSLLTASLRCFSQW